MKIEKTSAVSTDGWLQLNFAGCVMCTDPDVLRKCSINRWMSRCQTVNECCVCVFFFARYFDVFFLMFGSEAIPGFVHEKGV